MTTQRHIIPRHGEAPLEFTGVKLAGIRDELSDKEPRAGKPDFRRWHEVRIYRTEQGQIVASVEYHAPIERMVKVTAEVFPGLEEASAWLMRYNPAADVGGFPPTGPQMEERRRQVAAEVARRFGSLVTQALQAAKYTEEVA